MRRLFILAIAAGLCSCSKTTDTRSGILLKDTLPLSNSFLNKIDDTAKTAVDYESLFELRSYLVENVTVDSTFQIVDVDCAILVYPSDQQIEEIKKTEGEDNFYIIADDNNWYHGLSIEKMDSVGIRQETCSGQYLRLKGDTKTWDLDVRKKNLPAWNLIFFKRSKEPQVISTVDLTFEQIREYFEIAN